MKGTLQDLESAQQWQSLGTIASKGIRNDCTLLKSDCFKTKYEKFFVKVVNFFNEIEVVKKILKKYKNIEKGK